MAGDNPRQAVENFRSPLQRALSCVTRSVITIQSDYAEDKEHALLVGRGEPCLLRGTDLFAKVEQRFRIKRAEGAAGPWRVVTTAYTYALLSNDDRRWILRYDWHPFTTEGIVFPHLHFGPAAQVQPEVLRKAHIPTGRVSLERFLHFLITDFGVEPLRPNWLEVLEQTGTAFDAWRIW